MITVVTDFVAGDQPAGTSAETETRNLAGLRVPSLIVVEPK